jgi:hypothetical protein
MIARGQGRRVPPLFALGGPSARQIGPALATAPEPGRRHRARGPPTKAAIQFAMESRRWGAHHFRPRHAAGPAVGPRQPSENQAPHPEPTDQGVLIMIRITLNGARRKGHRGHVTCGITPSIGEWPAPAATEVAR